MDAIRSFNAAALSEVLRYALRNAVRSAEHARIRGDRAQAMRLIELAYASLDLLEQIDRSG